MRKLFSNKWIYYIEKHRVTNSVIRMAFFAHGGISIKLFVVYLHIINECLSYKFHPYSILTGHTKVESVAYQVLMQYQSLVTASYNTIIQLQDFKRSKLNYATSRTFICLSQCDFFEARSSSLKWCYYKKDRQNMLPLANIQHCCSCSCTKLF